MLQFKNKTPFQGTILLMPDPDGIDSLYTVVKGTFSLGDRVEIAETQLPIALEDRFNGEPGQSSLKSCSDISLVKPATDVLLIGRAYAPGGKATTQMDVALTVGPVHRTVRVFGDRVWKAGFLRNAISEPAPFETMPLVWERAFGGADVANGKTPETHAENRNPVGTGFRVKDGQKKLEGLELPNLEDPAQLISGWKDRPAPAGFGPLCAHWEPRRSYAGTYDEEWQKQRAPYLPKDFDSRFFQIAPPDLVAPGYLTGGEPVEILGATPSGRLAFQLPEYHVQATYRLDSGEETRPASLETVLVEPDQSRLVLSWRTVLQCDKKALKVREIEATTVASARGV